MSVLFKALQKAEKENEQRQAASSGFDAGRLAGSGAIRFAGGRGINWRLAGLAGVGLVGIALTGVYFFIQTQPPGSQPVAVLQPPPAAAPVAPAQQTAEAAPAPVPPGDTTAAQPASPAATDGSAPTPVPEGQVAEAAPAAVQDEAVTPDGEQQEASAPEEAETPAAATVAEAKPAAKPAAPAPPARREMPELAPDAPARMLNPPIAIQRAEFELAGVGNAVQVRHVSQSAQDNVSAGYNALVRGAYDMALDFYDRALKDEPNSVLALLGRGAALQKMGRTEDAHASYEKVLKLDPANREALSNLTVILGERSPGDALTKLLDLEKEYPSFSPVKAQIGLTYAKLGSMPEALDYLNRATLMAPESVMYQYNMALVLDHLGRKEQAVSVYETVLASLASGRAAPELSSNDIERRVRFLKAR